MIAHGAALADLPMFTGPHDKLLLELAKKAESPKHANKAKRVGAKIPRVT